jgi:hypothetical protein
VATFSSTILNTVGSYTFTATDGSRSLTTATSTPATAIGPGSASKLVYTTAPPSSATAGSTFSVVVAEEDANGNTETNDSTTSISLAANNGGGGFSCSTVPTGGKVTNGVATYSGCLYTVASGTAFTLTASSGSLTSATANTTVSAGSASALVYSTAPPSSTSAGSTFSVVVNEQDAYGNTETGDSSTTVSLAANNGGGGFSCSTSPTSVTNGVATYTGCSYTVASGTAFTLTASSGSLTTATSNTTVSPGSATKLIYSTAPPSSTSAGTTFSVVVAEQDAYSNTVTGDSSTTLSLSANNGGGGFTCSSTPTHLTSGVATFAGCSYTVASGTAFTLTASSGSLTPATANTTVSPATATNLIFTVQPVGNVAEGTNFSVQPTVSVEDPYGNVVTSDTGSVTIGISSYATGNGGTTEGTVGCTNNTVSAVSGVATFAGCQVTGTAGAGTYTLSAARTGLSTGVSSGLTIDAGGASQLAFVQQPTNANATLAISPAASVEVLDSNGNSVSYSSGEPTISLSVSAPGTITAGGSATTNSAGVATFSSLTIGTAGASLNLTASSTGITSATSSTFTVSVLVTNGATLTDTASDAGSGVQSVSYYYCSGFTGSCTSSNWTPIGTSSGSSPYSVTWTGQPVDGPYEVVAVGTDNVDNSSDPSSSIPVSVNN